MKKIYTQMLKDASVYLKKGREFDFLHTRQLLKLAPNIIQRERLDESVMIPALIFHDAGWGAVPRRLLHDYHSKEARLEHMRIGATLASRILTKLKYPKDKTERICYLVSVHDYQSTGVGKKLKDKDTKVLAGIDFLWRVTKHGFKKDFQETGNTPQEQLRYIQKRAKQRRLFTYKALGATFDLLVSERKKEYQQNKKKK